MCGLRLRSKEALASQSTSGCRRGAPGNSRAVRRRLPSGVGEVSNVLMTSFPGVRPGDAEGKEGGEGEGEGSVAMTVVVSGHDGTGGRSDGGVVRMGRYWKRGRLATGTAGSKGWCGGQGGGRER